MSPASPELVTPSSLGHDLGRVLRVKAKPMRGRFASLDTSAMARAGSYEEDGGGTGHDGRPDAAVLVRRAISVQLATIA